MTGGFQSVPIMKPNRCWVVLYVSMLAGLLLTSKADSEDTKCETEVRVRRNTVYEAFVGKDFNISCLVLFCNNSPPSISWFKVETSVVPVNVSNGSHIKKVWKTQTHFEGTSYLIFMNIVSSDSGQYRCHSGLIAGHSINVSVYDKEELTTAPWNTSSSTLTPGQPEKLMYVYFTAGIVAFVIMIIIISIISMRGCKGSKQERKTDNQYMEIPIMEQPSLQASPRGSPPAPLPRRSTRRKSQEEQPSETTSPVDNQHVYGKIREDRQRQRHRQMTEMEEEGGSLVYAALNHQVPPRAAARQPRPQEDYSEYAAIRV